MNLTPWAVLASIATATVVGIFYGVQLVVLTLAAGALLLVIWLLWRSVQSLAGESQLTFEDAFSLGARSAEEEQKRAVLRALKDLDFERSIGKISEEDYQEYSARYRAQAKLLIRHVDESLAEARKVAERDLERRLAKLPGKETRKSPEPADEEPSDPLEPIAEAEAVSSPIAAEIPEKSPKKTATTLRACAACAVNNELDARFCKGCGAALAEPGQKLCGACPARFPEADPRCPECGTESESKS